MLISLLQDGINKNSNIFYIKVCFTFLMAFYADRFLNSTNKQAFIRLINPGQFFGAKTF